MLSRLLAFVIRHNWTEMGGTKVCSVCGRELARTGRHDDWVTAPWKVVKKGSVVNHLRLASWPVARSR